MTESFKELTLIQAGDPVLREVTRPLSKEEILSSDIQQLIFRMKAQMRAAPGVGLAAPQIGRAIQLIVIEDRADYHIHLAPEQLLERERVEVPFHVVINPVLSIIDHDQVEFFEGCLSVLGFMGKVGRAKKVKVKCLNEKAESIQIEASGWYARILQHEIDHLNGILYVDRMDPRTFMTGENYKKFWQHKP